MGHLPIVNQGTVQEMIDGACISTRGDLKKYVVKTTADIFSDVLSTRKGDLVFPWIVRENDVENLGFKYVFKIAGPPIFRKGEQYPICVPLEEEGIEYANPVSEAEAVDLWRRELLWNAIGKKSLGRGRSLTHQTPMEDGRLKQLLDDKNPQGPKRIRLGPLTRGGTSITINPEQASWTSGLKARLESANEHDRISQLELAGIPWRRRDCFAVEKVLEAWLMENLDKAPAKQLRDLALAKDLPIMWFANYLPFGVQGGNMDVVILQGKKSAEVATVIELKVKPLSEQVLIKASSQVEDYCIFIGRALKAFGVSVEVRGLVLSASPKRRVNSVAGSGSKRAIGWIGYGIEPSGLVTFERLA